MRIIKEGVKPSTEVEFKCRKCGTIFAAVMNLEARRIYDQRDGDYWQCDCPLCNQFCTKAAK